MGIDTDTGSQMEGRARLGEGCKVRARRLETILGAMNETFCQSSCELSGISEGGASSLLGKKAGNEALRERERGSV